MKSEILKNPKVSLRKMVLAKTKTKSKQGMMQELLTGKTGLV